MGPPLPKANSSLFFLGSTSSLNFLCLWTDYGELGFVLGFVRVAIFLILSPIDPSARYVVSSNTSVITLR